MKVLVLGSGGREHALVAKFREEKNTVFFSPGNPGVPAEQATCLAGEPVDIARQVAADLVVVGPEIPLIEGVADRLREAGFVTFGPGAAGAKLEGSKAYSKALMAAAGVPTAKFQSFTHYADAVEYARTFYETGGEVVVKASGAAFGKGAVMCPTFGVAQSTLRAMLTEHAFGEAGHEVVVEERMQGREFSLLTVCSDHGIVSLPVAQDFKRIGEGDTGLNTGGVGSYSPVDWVSAELARRTEERLVLPILAELKRRGIGYRGVLFTGVMLQPDGEPYCIEYNVRMGDPETQSVLPRIQGFTELVYAAAKGEPLPAPRVLENCVLTVILCSQGYPETFEKGFPITVPDLDPRTTLSFAGVAQRDGQLVTQGGRVVAVTACADTLEEARKIAYLGANSINFEKKYYRKDIGP